MSVIVLTGGPGAPGITTTALGLTLQWPGDVMLSDCDRDPAQAIPAGYLRGLDLRGRGLATLARLHREARDFSPDLLGQTVPLCALLPPRVCPAGRSPAVRPHLARAG